jgi:hypothetical protein
MTDRLKDAYELCAAVGLGFVCLVITLIVNPRALYRPRKTHEA